MRLHVWLIVFELERVYLSDQKGGNIGEVERVYVSGQGEGNIEADSGLRGGMLLL